MNKHILITVFFALMHSVCTAKTFLVFGGSGWIGSKVVALLRNAGHTARCAQSRLENRESIEREIDQTQPDYLINAAGITGKPNVDWCEKEGNRQTTIRCHIIGTLNVADIAYRRGLHLTNFATGCIYLYDDEHPMGSGIGFTEEEAPNFIGSFYSRTKVRMEEWLNEYPNVLNLRIKMPISIDLEPNLGFLAKIIRFKKVVNIPNSLTILDELLPYAIDMTMRELKGTYNFVNPGAMSHIEVLELYKKYVDPSHTWETFSEEEQAKILQVPRANAELSAAKLCALYPTILPIRESLIQLLKSIKERYLQNGEFVLP